VLDLLKEEEFKKIAKRSGETIFTLPYSRAEEEAIKIVDQLAALGGELSDLKAKPKDALTAEETARLNYIEQTKIPAANKALRLATEALAKVAPDVKDALDARMKDNIQAILPALGKGVVALYTVVGKTSVDENAEDKTASNNSVNKTDDKTASNKINIGWILLVTPEFRKAYPIDTKDLEQTVFKFREALRSPAYDAQPLAQELYKKLFLQTSDKQKTTLAADLETYLGKEKDKTLMWSLDGVLRYIPMAALHDGKGYLVEKYRNVVFNTASLGSLKDAVKPNWEVVGLGVSTEGTVKAYDGRMLRFSALQGSEGELNSIVKEKNRAADAEGIFPGTLKINNEFTKEALFEGARTGMPVIHISSHFWFNPAQEETSFLLLGNGGRLEITEFQDYPNLFTNVDFLSLSACDTATGGSTNNSNAAVTGKAENEQNARESNGKEIEGFAYVAQTLGAKSVMASLWQVSDQGTKELMLKFYQIKKEQPQLPKGEALRQAQLSLLRGTYQGQASGEQRQLELVEVKGSETLKPFKKDEKAPFAHPYYWSSFILIGNWR
jgi:CHAT domain-containing protein